VLRASLALMVAPSLGSIRMPKWTANYSSNNLRSKMLEGYDLLKALNGRIVELSAKLGAAGLAFAPVCGADLFYTDGGAVGAYMKLAPFNFYYDAQGRPHYGCVGDCYGTAIRDWIAAVAAGRAPEPTSVWV
jgi:hypothetical protein